MNLTTAARTDLQVWTVYRQRPKGDRSVVYDLRPFVDALAIADDAGTDVTRSDVAGSRTVRVAMRLRHDPEKGVGRPEEVLAELGERLGAPLEVVACRRTRLVLADDAPAQEPRPRRRTAIPAAGPRRAKR